jgi:hypothetical protein
MAEKENPAALAGADRGIVKTAGPEISSWISCTTIERFRVGDRETERTTIEGGAFLEVSFVDNQPDAIENNSDRYTFKLTTPGGQPCEIDDREVNEVKFTIVGNWELADFLSGMAALLHLRRK